VIDTPHDFMINAFFYLTLVSPLLATTEYGGVFGLGW
jgi:hypothetical protein